MVTRGVRLPGFEDRDALHYIDCLVLEALRWNPASPTAFAHRLLQDDEYKGYLIPKGSLVLGNTWALCRDEGMFPDPDNFNPDRYLRGPKGERHPAEAYVAAAFGYGRRYVFFQCARMITSGLLQLTVLLILSACPGRSLALDTIWLTIAQVLAIFDVLKDVDERGAELTPNVKFTHGLVSCVLGLIPGVRIISLTDTIFLVNPRPSRVASCRVQKQLYSSCITDTHCRRCDSHGDTQIFVSCPLSGKYGS